MRFPVWLTIGLAVLVIVFGIHRIRISFRSDEEDKRATERKGMYAMSRRRHRLLGILYVVLGSLLIATAFGFNPFGTLLGPSTETPKQGTAPTEAPLPPDGLKR